VPLIAKQNIMKPIDTIGLQMDIIQEGLKKALEETEGKDDCGYDTCAHIREEGGEMDFFPEPHDAEPSIYN
jgi:hypothetical protein